MHCLDVAGQEEEEALAPFITLGMGLFGPFTPEPRGLFKLIKSFGKKRNF